MASRKEPGPVREVEVTLKVVCALALTVIKINRTVNKPNDFVRKEDVKFPILF
jgi:hypothetical protein